jgi:hypothetical protein
LSKKAILYDVLAIVMISLVVILSQWYVLVIQEYDITTFFEAVALPIIFGSIILLVSKRRTLLFAFIAYFWSLVDDAPVNFDSVFTWPEVTSGSHHIFMEIVLHTLTIVFLYLTIREALKGTTITQWKTFKVSLLTFIAFVLSYAQNIPLSAIQAIVVNEWYPLDIIEHVTSMIFFYLAIREAMKLRVSTRFAM